MLPLIAIGVVIALAKSNVIPSNNLGNNVSVHTMTKRQDYQSIWSNNREPLEICPAIEASLAPSIESRFCDVEPDNEDDLDKYFVTVGDIQGRTSWLKDKNHKGNNIKNRNFGDYSGEFNDHIYVPIKNDMLWTYDKSFTPDKDSERYLAGYNNQGNTIVGDQNLKFFRIDDVSNSNPPGVSIENLNEKYRQINNIGIQQSKVTEENTETHPTVQISPPTPINDGSLTTECSPEADASATEDTQLEKTSRNVSSNLQPAPEVIEQKRQETTIEDLERTNELMNEILEKLKEVQHFEQIEKNIKTFVNKLRGELLVESRAGKQPQTSQVSDNSSSTLP
ncbi:hypothetical protein QE152_g15752 [Popillia japonica]|uniref:Uncharacterized protein n=1 Tax=Popillia japonica TaxID=7064 RepID=A0AAW1L705_POPJA